MRTQIVLAAVMAVGLAAPVAAQTTWSVAFNVGGDITLSGDVHGGGSGSVLNLPTTVEARGYGDVYGTPFTWSADLGYGVGGAGEVRGRLFRTSGGAESLQVGTVAGLPLFAQFADYSAVGMEVGYRHFLSGGMVRPFAGGNVGFLRVDENSGTFSVPAANVTIPNVPMTASTTVPVFSFSAGVMIPIGGSFGLQGGFDLRWQGDLDPVEGLAGTGLETINDDTSRWSMPLTVGAVVRF